MGKEVVEWVKTVVLSVVIALVITTFVKPTIVKQDSMNPTLNEFDFLIINRLLYKQSEPQNGDIVVFKSNLPTSYGQSKLLIKRIIAIPGDTILISDGRVYLNEVPLNEEYIIKPYSIGKDIEGIPVKIPSGKVFVMGDNRPNSRDSRDHDIFLVDIKDIIGNVVVRLYPINDIRLFNS